MSADERRPGPRTGAIEPLERAIKSASDGDVMTRFFLSMALTRTGDKSRSRLWYDKVADWTAKKRPEDQGLLRLRAEAAAILGLSGAPIVTRDTK
jgi:hypothetical protein